LLNHGTSGAGGTSILGPLTGPSTPGSTLPPAPGGGPLPLTTSPAAPTLPPKPSGPSVPTN